MCWLVEEDKIEDDKVEEGKIEETTCCTCEKYVVKTF